MRFVLLAVLAAFATPASAEPAFIKSGDGPGATFDGTSIRLLAGGEGEANGLVLPASADRPPEWVEVRASVSLQPGGDGFGLVLLDAGKLGAAAVAPPEVWDEPNRADAIGIGFDARNPASSDAFDADGNLYDRPQREVSVHVDGRETFNRQSADFATGDAVPVVVRVAFVAGGARLSVRVGTTDVYADELLPGVRAFAPRVMIGARAGGKVTLGVAGLEVKVGPPLAAPFAEPTRVVLFDRTVVSVNTSREPTATASFADVPRDVARVIATLTIAAPPGGIDKWDRRGAVYLYADDGQRYELLRFKTPFSREWEWRADVTDFLPLFAGRPKVGLFIDTWRDGFATSVTLDFYPGVAERRPVKVVNLWQGEPILGDPQRPLAAFFDTRRVDVPAGATAATLRLMASGHGQFPNSKNAGEFLGLHRRLVVNGRAFENLLWKADNYLNPCRPQKGTWKYDRAGWGPGTITAPWTLDLTPIVAASRRLEVDYAITDDYVNAHVGKGDPPTHWVDGQVIFYADRAPATTRPAR